MDKGLLLLAAIVAVFIIFGTVALYLGWFPF